MCAFAAIQGNLTMPQSLAALYIHVVFSTKNREPYITPDLEPQLYAFMHGIAKNHDCIAWNIGGMPDHTHILLALHRDRSVFEMVRFLKANSSKWVHETFPDRSFAWQNGYAAFSVSASNVAKVQAYIENQKKNHAKRTFQEEMRILYTKHGVEWDERYAWD